MKSKIYYQTFKCARCGLERTSTNKDLFYKENSSSCYCRKCNNDLVRERRAKGTLRKDPCFSEYCDVEKWYRAHGTKGMKDSADSIVLTMKSIWGNKWEWHPEAKRIEFGVVMQWNPGCLREGWKYKNLNVAGE